MPKNIPIVVIVNKGSASASEILAGALKDNHLAYIIGQNTYGKGSVQQMIPLSDTDIVTTYCEYGGVYLIYPTYILDVSGANPYKRIAKLSKYVTFEAIKGDVVYLRTSNNKIITTTLLKNN